MSHLGLSLRDEAASRARWPGPEGGPPWSIGGAITSNQGRPCCCGETDRRIGLFDRVAACFTDGRDPRLTEHSVWTQVAQLRHDPLLAAAVRRARGRAQGLRSAGAR